MKNFNLEYQYQLYLEKVNLNENEKKVLKKFGFGLPFKLTTNNN